MAATDEMVGIACRLKPEMAMLVPEGRHEVTTEGGLDVVGQEARLQGRRCARLADAGIVTSVFIDAELPQVEAAARIGARVCEIHTGPYAHAFHERGRDAESAAVLAELDKIRAAGAGDPRPRHALQCRPCAQLLQRAAGRARCRACANCTSATPSSAAPCSSACAKRCAEMKRLMREAQRQT